jgi:protein gp37
MGTAIEWTDETWNPTTGCDHVSEGCRFCYIDRTPPFRIEGRYFDEQGKMGVRLHPDRLDKPLHWRKPRRVFVNSLSDLFHPEIPDEFICDVFTTMGRAQQHTFQVLTKRPQRMAAIVSRISWRDVKYPLGPWVEPADLSMASAYLCEGEGEEPLPGVWLGTSIENDRYTWRADHLRNTPAAIRFLSLEPLIGPVPSLDLDGIDWVIVGGESGPHARPMHPDWARDIRDRCVAAGVPFFFKQWGAWRPGLANTPGSASPLNHGYFCGDGRWLSATGNRATSAPGTREHIARVGKANAGRLLDGRTWDEMPEHAGVVA